MNSSGLWLSKRLGGVIAGHLSGCSGFCLAVAYTACAKASRSRHACTSSCCATLHRRCNSRRSPLVCPSCINTFLEARCRLRRSTIAEVNILILSLREIIDLENGSCCDMAILFRSSLQEHQEHHEGIVGASSHILCKMRAPITVTANKMFIPIRNHLIDRSKSALACCRASRCANAPS